MQIKATIAILFLLTTPAYAQTGTPKSLTQLNTEINSQFPDQLTGAITPYILRQLNLDMVASAVLGQSAATVGQIPVYPGSGGAAVPTSASAWFDNAYCNTVGYILARTSGAWTCSRDIPINVVWMGADKTGSVDATTIINGIVTIANTNAGTCIYFPSGLYKVSTLTALNTNFNPCIKGNGPYQSRIVTSSTTGNVITFSSGGGGGPSTGNTYAISDIGFDASVTRVSGAFLSVGASWGTIKNVDMNNMFYGIDSTDNAGVYDSITFNYTGVTNAISGAEYIRINGSAGGVNINNVLSGAVAVSFQATYGLHVISAGSLNLININLIRAGTCIRIDAGASIWGTQVDCDNSVYGLYIVPSGSNNVVRVHMTKFRAGSMSSDGVHVDGSGTSGIVSGITLNHSTSVLGATSGMFFKNASDIQIVGGSTVAGNTGAGIVVDTGVTGISIIGNHIGNYNGEGANGSVGVSLNSTADYIQIIANQLVGNTGGAMYLGASGTHQTIKDNAGYNPVGTTAAASTGTTGSTITAGPSPETHYVKQSGSFNAAITKGGQAICTVPSAAVPCVIELGPNEAYSVAWSVITPTNTKDVH